MREVHTTGALAQQKRRGILLGAVACVLWSATFPCLRWIFVHHEADAVAIACMRYVFAGAILLGYLMLRGRACELLVVWKRPFTFAFLAVTGIAGMGAMVALGNELTQSINAAVLMNSNPVLIVLLGFFIGERLTVARLGGVALGLAGCLLVIHGSLPTLRIEGATDLLGCLASLAGALLWAVYTLASKSVTRKHGGLVTTTGAVVLGAVFLAVLIGVTHRPVNLHPQILLVMAFVGLAPTAIAFTLWNAALNHIDAGTAGPLQYLSPVGAMALAWPTLHEAPTWPLLVGLTLIVSGITLCTRDELSRSSEGEESRED